MKVKYPFNSLQILLVFLFLFANVSLSRAFSFEKDGIYYTILGSSEVAVTKAESGNYNGNIVIPSKVENEENIYGVIAIGNEAFADSKELSSVSLPSSIISIGDYAFIRCSSLTTINLPASIKDMGMGAFAACESLESIDIPSSLEYISNMMFQSCTSLNHVGIPDTVKQIGAYAFAGCSSLVGIYLPNGLFYVGHDAFYGCESLKNINLENTLIEEIPNDLFKECKSLETVYLTKDIEKIGNTAFADCSSLSSLRLPSKVSEIGEGAFRDCSNLSELTVAEDNKYFCSIDGVLYNKSVNRLIAAPGYVGDFEIPDSVNEIVEGAFYHNTKIASVKIPEGVEIIPQYAFYSCTSLKTVYLPSSLKKIADYSFHLCTSLSSINFPENIEEIGANSFYFCSSLPLLNLSACKSLVTIKESAFQFCSSLETCELPESLISIGSFVFNSCNSLKEITIPANVENIDFGTFTYSSSLENIFVDPNNPYFTSKEGLLYNKELTRLVACPGKKDNITIPETVETIGVWSCKGCSSLSKVTCLALTVPTINMEAFREIADDAVLFVDETVINEYKSSKWSDYFNTILAIGADTGIENIFPEELSDFSVYSINGLLILNKCSKEMLKTLPKGIYVIVSNKTSYKISI